MNILMPTFEDTMRYGRGYNRTASGRTADPSLCGSITRGLGYRNLAGRMAAMGDGGCNVNFINYAMPSPFHKYNYISLNTGIYAESGQKYEITFIANDIGNSSVFLSDWSIKGPFLQWNNGIAWHYGGIKKEFTMSPGEPIHAFLGEDFVELNGVRSEFAKGISSIDYKEIKLFYISNFANCPAIKLFKVFNNSNELLLDIRAAKDENDVVCFYDMVGQNYIYSNIAQGFSLVEFNP